MGYTNINGTLYKCDKYGDCERDSDFILNPYRGYDYCSKDPDSDNYCGEYNKVDKNKECNYDVYDYYNHEEYD